MDDDRNAEFSGYRAIRESRIALVRGRSRSQIWELKILTRLRQRYSESFREQVAWQACEM